MRKQYDIELSQLKHTLIQMAAAAENAIRNAVTALTEKDAQLAREVMQNDQVINSFEKSVEQQALRIIYREQPVAEDLRDVSTALKMVTDIERIGDQAADICEIALKIIDSEYCKELIHIPDMAARAVKMVADSVRAYVNADLTLARRVIEKDDAVDALFERIKNELVQIIQSTPAFAEQVLYLLMIAKYLERIGDHAVNIAEWVIFNLTGLHKNARVL